MTTTISYSNSLDVAAPTSVTTPPPNISVRLSTG